LVQRPFQAQLQGAGKEQAGCRWSWTGARRPWAARRARTRPASPTA